MLRREERSQHQAGNELWRVGGEEIDGAVSLAVEAGLVGEQAEAQVISVALGSFGESGVVCRFEDVDAGEGLCGA